MTADTVEWSRQEVARRAVRGGLALATRQVVMFSVSVAGGVLLARVLSPKEYGVYVIANFWLNLLLVIGNAGLGGALVQQSAEPTGRDLDLVFTAQTAMGLLLGVAGVIAAPWLAAAYGLSAAGVEVMRLFAVALMIQAVQAVPIIRLERELRFGAIGYIGAAEVLTFNGMAVGLAYAGWGVRSFGLAIAAQALVGAAGAWWCAPWRPHRRWDRVRLRELLAFGIPFQGSTIVSLVKDSLTPTFVGLLLGVHAVGLIGWAQSAAAFALFALTALSRLWVPAFARLADDREALARAVNSAVRWMNTAVAPVALILLVLIHPITHLVYGDRWKAGVNVFYLLWPANLVVPTVAVLTGMLTAVGRVRLTFLFTMLWMLATWILGAPLIGWLGIVGYGWTNLAVQTTNVVVFRAARREVHASLVRAAVLPWTLGAPLALVLYVVQRTWPARSLSALALYALSMAISYVVAVVLTGRDELRQLTSLARSRYTG